jgi:amino-acid N-acetyltransferase
VNSEFEIRDARITDAPAIAALVRDAGLPVEGIERTQFTVAEHAGRIVGCAGLEVHGDAALLRSVAVDAGWRGRRVGDALVRALLDSAVRLKLDPVVLLTTTAPGWFPRFGFEVTTRTGIPPALLESAEFKGACPDTATVMARPTR